MKVLIFQHEPFEAPGYILEWARLNNMEVNFVEFFKQQLLPKQHNYDLLVIMGGSMSVNDEQIYPWLTDEKKFILEGISLRKKMVGICLGSQLLAACLGSKVYKNRWREIGFFDVFTQNQNHPVLKNIPKQFTAFHWHGETFDLPENAIHLALSEACINQAFIWNNQLLGLQFHIEVTQELLNIYLSTGTDELKSAERFVQTANEMLAMADNLNLCNELLDNMLSNFIKL